MKRFFCLLTVLLLLPLAQVLGEKTVLYTTTGKISAPIYAEMDLESQKIGRVNPGYSVKVYALYPEWAYVSCSGDTGYALRKHLEIGKPVDRTTTPPWGVSFYHYVGVAGINGVNIYSEANHESEVLISLGENARISLIDIENGWARLGYFRQYGYVDTNDLKDLLPVCTDAFSGTDDAPIATFTSYYVSGSEDISEHGKEVNIGVNCQYMNDDVLQPGKTLDYNNYFGPFSYGKGYVKGPVLIETGWGLGPGGGVCQVSSTLYNVLLQLPGVSILLRRSHGNDGAEYLPLDMDAAVGNEAKGINMIFRNDYDFPLRFEAYAQDGALFLAIYRVTEE